MIEGLSLDQLRIFAATVDEGSFSAAGRRVRRAQSAVSQAIATLETQLGVRLFDRAGRYPQLTAAGNALLADARRVLADLDAMKARARGIAQGLEAELGLVADVLFPIDRLALAVERLHAAYPATALALSVEALGAVVRPVLERHATVGIASLPDLPGELAVERIGTIEMIAVAAPHHPLAAGGEATRADLSRHIQLVLTDRSPLTKGREFGIFSAARWRLADMGAKHALLRRGLGWGGMPAWLVADDIAADRLCRLTIRDDPASVHLPVYAIHRHDHPPGPVARAFIEDLKGRAIT